MIGWQRRRLVSTTVPRLSVSRELGSSKPDVPILGIRLSRLVDADGYGVEGAHADVGRAKS